jgi:hypothetical protein
MDNPVRVSVDYPEKVSRGLLILRLLLGWLYVLIPHGICLFFYGIAALIVIVIAWFAALFTGKYPRGMFDFVVGLYRWQMRVNAYMLFLTDSYPPFSGKEHGSAGQP